MLRHAACASIRPKPWPRARRLAIANGMAAPTRKENAGWIRSWSEHPCHGTCVVLDATIAHGRLSGNAAWSVHSRIASASMSNMTKPRNASMEVMRPGTPSPAVFLQERLEGVVRERLDRPVGGAFHGLTAHQCIDDGFLRPLPPAAKHPPNPIFPHPLHAR